MKNVQYLVTIKPREMNECKHVLEIKLSLYGKPKYVCMFCGKPESKIKRNPNELKPTYDFGDYGGKQIMK